jgi:hypothetical protein
MSVPRNERRCPNCNELAGPNDLACGRCGLPLPDIPRWASGRVGADAPRSGPFHSGRVTEDPTMPTINPNATATGTPLVFSGPSYGAASGPQTTPTQIGAPPVFSGPSYGVGPGPQTAPAQVGAPPGVLDGSDLTQPGQPTPPGGVIFSPGGPAAPGGVLVGQAPPQNWQAGQPVGAGASPLQQGALGAFAPPAAPGGAAARGASGWMALALSVLAVLVVLEGIGLLVLFFRPAGQTTAQQPGATATRVPGVTPSPVPQDVLYRAKWRNGAFDGWSVNPNDQFNDWSAGDGRLINDGGYTSDIGTAPSITAPANVLQGVKNYAIEATIAVLGAGPSAGFGFFVAYADGSPPSGYILGVSSVKTPLSQLWVSPAANWSSPRVQTIFSPGSAPHLYRIEVRDGQIRFLVDGVAILEPPFDASDATGTLVGLWCAQARLVISSFVVFKLP